MPQIPLRRARTDIALKTRPGAPGGDALPPGEWFVEQHARVMRVFEDPDGATHVADVDLVDFLDGLATRQIVFVSWG